MTKDEVASLLDSLVGKESVILDPPSTNDWLQLEKKFGCSFPEEFRYFIELKAEYRFPGDVLNVSSGRSNGNDTIQFTYDDEMLTGFWDEALIPFYSLGNGDYFCLCSKACPNTGVFYYSHEDFSVTKEAATFEEWLKNVDDFFN